MAEAAVAQTCIAITKKGPQCTREAIGPNQYLCFQHQSMLDKQNQALLKKAAYERARVLSDLGAQWRARRENTPGTEEHYQKYVRNN